MKLRARIEFVLEWEPQPKAFPEGTTPQEMAEIDERNIREAPLDFIDNFLAYGTGHCAAQNVRVEVVKEISDEPTK